MRLELGGGTRNRGEGWVNLDLCDAADIRHDLNVTPWPIAEDAVVAIYSSHCLEHLRCPHAIFSEICRVSRVGAPVEIRVPHPFSQMAFCAGHLHTFSPQQAENMERHFPRETWRGEKRLKLERIEYHPSELLERAKSELPFLAGVSDEAVMRFIPGACHECRFFYVVVANEFLDTRR